MQKFIPFLVGTKFDKFKEFDLAEQTEITNLVDELPLSSFQFKY
jgi:hypothetical protein